MSLYNIGLSALNASQSALRTTGHNISNANVAGYSRQQVELATASGNFSGAGFFGRGVDVSTVTRTQDVFLAREAVTAIGQATGDAARAAQLQQLENVFTPGEGGIGHKAGQLLNAFADVATRPQDVSARQVVLSRAAEVAAAFQAAGESVETLQRGVNEDLRTLAGEVTTLAARVAELNKAISAARGTGHKPNDLLDQRDELVREIGSKIAVTTVMADDGAMNLFIGGGQILVLGVESSRLATVPDEFDPTRSRVALQGPDGFRVLPGEFLTGGAIGGLMRFQDDDLVAARSLLGQMATALAGRLNTQQALGLDLTGQSGHPIFATDDPVVRPSTNNAVDGSGVPIASVVDPDGVRRPTVRLTVVDATQVAANEYALRASPSGVAGEYELTRLPGGQSVTVTSGTVVDGFRIDIQAPEPGPNDRFLLQPTGDAAARMRRVMDDPRGIAAASPVVGTVDPANDGTMAINALRPVAIDPSQPEVRVRIAFASAGSGLQFTWEEVDAANVPTGASGGPFAWTPGQPISSQGIGVGGRVQWSLGLVGVPRDGDTLTVRPTPNVGPNNGNAEALLALREERLVGRDPAAAPGVQSGASITDAWARAIGDIGLRTRSAKTAEATSTSVADRAVKDLKSATGVNLDEEAARLMQYQQSYQAAAKVLQVAQSVMDMLLRATDG